MRIVIRNISHLVYGIYDCYTYQVTDTLGIKHRLRHLSIDH